MIITLINIQVACFFVACIIAPTQQGIEIQARHPTSCATLDPTFTMKNCPCRSPPPSALSSRSSESPRPPNFQDVTVRPSRRSLRSFILSCMSHSCNVRTLIALWLCALPTQQCLTATRATISSSDGFASNNRNISASLISSSPSLS